MSVEIIVNNPIGTDHTNFIKKLEWFEKRIPSKEYRISIEDEELDWDENLIIRKVKITIWSIDADRVAFDYWWYHK